MSTRTSFITAVALGAFALVGGTGLTVSSAWLITMASQHPPILALSVAIVMVRFFGIFRSVARYAERVISHEAIFKKLTEVRVRLFSSFASRLSDESVTIAARSKSVIDDIERAQEFHLRVSLPGASAVLAGFVTLLLAAWINLTLLAWSTLLTLIFALVIPFLVKKFLDPIATEIEEGENLFAFEITSAADALIEAEIFGYGDKFRESLTNSAQALEEKERRFAQYSSLLQFITIASIGIALVGVATTFERSVSLLPITISMSLFLILVGFEGYTSWFPNLFPAGKNRRASRNIEELSHVTPNRGISSELPAHFAIKAVNCEPMWSEKFLIPINLECNEGATFIITGPSGVGKSTFAAAMMGFAHYSGSLTIGGVEVSAIDDLSRWVTGTLQHSHIFNTTLRENLKIADASAEDEKLLRVRDALELADIDLDEVLGEFGRGLSGGEAKRLAIARALLSPAPVIILDEPLEHLDHQRSLRIQESISECAVGRTLIVITHAPWLRYSLKLELARE